LTNKELVESFIEDYYLCREYFCKRISGIKDRREELADIIIYRIIFIWLIQIKGILNHNLKYLTSKFEEIKDLNLNYYQDFLNTLFFEGFNVLPKNREFKKQKILGDIPFLSPNIFIKSDLEDINKNAIKISNNAFYVESININRKNKVYPILNILERYKWDLNETYEDSNKLTPRILGILIEKHMNKDLGSVYTPRKISKYICERVIYSYILENINTGEKNPLEFKRLLKTGDLQFLNKIKDIVKNLRILDPATGTGHFLIESLYIIKDIYDILIEKEIIKAEKYKIIKEILLNYIFGVDINDIALRICKFRLYLAQINVYNGENLSLILPNISFNLRLGNSLVGYINNEKTLVSYFTNEDSILNKLSERNELIRKYKNINNDINPQLKEKIDEITLELNLFFNNKLISNIDLLNYGNSTQKGVYFLNNHNRIKIEPFNWFIEFNEILQEGGFDIILGNPPYIRHEKIEIKPILKKLFDTYRGTADLYIYFIENSIKLLKNNGYLGFIVSNKFTKTRYGKKIRDFIQDNCKIIEFIDYFENVVFSASVDPCIIILKKEKNNTKNQILVNNTYYTNQDFLKSEGWNFIDESNYRIKNYIENNSVILKEYTGEPLSGIKTGLSKVFVVDEEKINEIIKDKNEEKEIFVKFIRGKDIRRWKYHFNDEYLIFTDNIELDRYPNVKKYLLKYKKQLEKRTDILGTNKEWFELRPCTYYNKFKKDKIIYPDISEECNFTYDETGIFINNTAYALPTDDKALLAILNSKLIQYYYQFISVQLGKGFRFIQMYMNQVPIRKPSKKQRKILEIISDYMLFLHQIQINDVIEKYIKFFDDILLNCLVYELYFADIFEENGLEIKFYDLIDELIVGLDDNMVDNTKLKIIEDFYEEICGNIIFKENISALKQHEWIKIIENK
jgi:type I restriction-modification system DNA methylase subunit